MNLFDRFLKEEDGAELIEIAIGVGIVAVLAIGAWAVATSAQDTLTSAGGKIQDITDEIENGISQDGFIASPAPGSNGGVGDINEQV